MPFLQLAYKSLHYTDCKPSGDVRETFVFTHGLGSSQNYYSAVISKLLEEGYRCIAYDTTGSGRSPYTQVEQSISTLSADLVGVMDALDVKKAVVVGHSMGGIVAATVAAQNNPRVAAIVLIGPVHPSKVVSEIFKKRIRTVEEKGMEAMADTIPSAAAGRKASPLTRAFIRELLLAQDPAGYISNCRVIANASVPDYSKISAPALILAGSEDRSAPLEGCEKILKAIGVEEKRLEVLEGIGHWHCLEDFQLVAERILAFYHEIQ